MKLIDIYNSLKENYKSEIIFLKSGTFIVTFNEDAYIIKDLFNYQIKNNKVGFPKNALNKVENKLKEENINYIFYEDGNVVENLLDNNKYHSFKSESKKNEFNNQMKTLLIDRITYLINESEDNYDKIRRFIDEF